MIQIKKLEDISDYSVIKDLWNSEVGFIYPISDFIFNQNILDCKYVFRKGSFLAFDNNELIGFILAKIWDKDERIPNYQDIGWISLFYVSRKYRKKGIGSKLLLLVEDEFTKMGKKEIFIGKDINNFFPGIPIDFDVSTTPFFEKRGYTIGKCTHDLINEHIMNCRYKLVNDDKFIFRFATKEDQKNVLQFMLKNFPGRWFYECEEYFKKGHINNDFLIVLDKINVIAFIRVSDIFTFSKPYNMTWHQRFQNLGGLGPLGVDRNYRGINLGSDIVKAGINSLYDKGINEIIIDWTSLIDFYSKFGFEVWKCYRYISKRILNNN